MMKIVENFIKKNKFYVLLLGNICLLLCFIHVINYIPKTFANDTIGDKYEYDSLIDGDIVTFNSTIDGKLDLYSRVDYVYPLSSKTLIKDSDFSSDSYVPTYVTGSTLASYWSVYYCKDEECLDDYNYDLITPLYKSGKGPDFSYEVLSYNEAFGTDDSTYTAWEIYFVPRYFNIGDFGHVTQYNYNYGYMDFYGNYNFGYVYYYDYNDEYAKLYLIGDYYDIVLIPTTKNENICWNNEENIMWNKVLEYEAEYDDVWVSDKNSFYYDQAKISAVDGGEYKINFEIPDDIELPVTIAFDLKTNSTNLTFTLDGKDITDELKITDEEDLYEHFGHYVHHEYEVNDRGAHTLVISQALAGNKTPLSDVYVSDNIDQIVYIDNFMLLNEVAKGSEIDNSVINENVTLLKTVKCNRFLVLGEMKEISKIQEENPQTGGNVVVIIAVVMIIVAVMWNYHFYKKNIRTNE